MTVVGRLVLLRDLTPEDVGDHYLAWMRDPAVNRHLESRFEEHSLASLTSFVEEHAGRADVLLLAIVERSSGRHIGNIKVGPLHPHHGTADLGLLIGDHDAHGRGYGTEAIRLATELGFARLGARKLTASCYADNVASSAGFRRAGWSEEGSRPAQFVDDEGGVQDQVMFGIVRLD